MKKHDFKALLKSIDELKMVRAGKKMPARVFDVKPMQVKEIRRKLQLSQLHFANMIGISPATLRNWEQGRTYPEGAARALLTVASKRPDAILDALGEGAVA